MLTDEEIDRYRRIMLVREYISSGHSQRQAAKDLQMSGHTIQKYLTGDPMELCRRNYDCNKKCENSIEPYLDFITDCINGGKYPSEIHKELQRRFHYSGSYHAFYRHLKRNEKQRGWVLCTQNHPNGHVKKHPQMISRKTIFRPFWNRQILSDAHRQFIFDSHPKLYVIDKCIREFRDIFERKCVNRLHCFIENYSVCNIPSLERFAKGLLSDIDAVELAVSSPWSNGFVEGQVNRIKTVKRLMFGRAGLTLLRAKLLLLPGE